MHAVLIILALWLVWKLYCWRINCAKHLMAAVINENARLRGEMEPFELPAPRPRSQMTPEARLLLICLVVGSVVLGVLIVAANHLDPVGLMPVDERSLTAAQQGIQALAPVSPDRLKP